MTSINRISPFGLRGLLTALTSNGAPSAGEFEGCKFRAMILSDTNTLSDPTLWETVQFLDDAGYILSEYDNGSAGSLRVDLSAIALSPVGADVFLSIAAPIWPALPVSGANPSHILFYAELAAVAADLLSFGDTTVGNLAHRTPVALMDAVFVPDGSTFAPAVPPNGLFSLRTNGC